MFYLKSPLMASKTNCRIIEIIRPVEFLRGQNENHRCPFSEKGDAAAVVKHIFDARSLTSLKAVWEDRKWIGGV
jgi:hypothetical protein